VPVDLDHVRGECRVHDAMITGRQVPGVVSVRRSPPGAQSRYISRWRRPASGARRPAPATARRLALTSTPGATASATQSRHRPSGPRPPYVLSSARVPPVLCCRGLANHRVPVTTNHLPGGKPESAAKTRTARLRRST